MLFYTMLLIASLAAALLVLWLYNLTVLVGKKIRRTRKLRKYADQMSLARKSTHGRNLQMASNLRMQNGAQSAIANGPMQTSWTGKIQNHDDYRPHARDANASTLSGYLARKNQENQSQFSTDWRRDVGRPIRDDRSRLNGLAYRPYLTRHTRKSQSNVVHKPWGW